MRARTESSGWRRDCQSREAWAAPPATRGTGSPASIRAGFTLIEVLLALVLLAALLTAINQFVFSITEAWTKNHDQFVFVQHTRAVSRHLDELLQAAANSARATPAPRPARPAVGEIHLPEGGGTANMLGFDLPVGDRLFTWPGQPLPEVRCALGWRKDEGLMIYWKSRLEKILPPADPRAALVSPFVTALAYDYYDDDAELDDGAGTPAQLAGTYRGAAPAPPPFLPQGPRIRGDHHAAADQGGAARLLKRGL